MTVIKVKYATNEFKIEVHMFRLYLPPDMLQFNGLSRDFKSDRDRSGLTFLASCLTVATFTASQSPKGYSLQYNNNSNDPLAPRSPLGVANLPFM